MDKYFQIILFIFTQSVERSICFYTFGTVFTPNLFLLVSVVDVDVVDLSFLSELTVYELLN